jgi:hypothetical protein
MLVAVTLAPAVVVALKAPVVNVGHVVQSRYRSILTGCNSGSFRSRACPNDRIRIYKPASTARCSSSKQVARPVAVVVVADKEAAVMN